MKRWRVLILLAAMLYGCMPSAALGEGADIAAGVESVLEGLDFSRTQDIRLSFPGGEKEMSVREAAAAIAVFDAILSQDTSFRRVLTNGN